MLVFSIHLISFREAQWTDSRWLSTPYVMVYLFIAFQLFSVVDSWWGGDMPDGCNEVREHERRTHSVLSDLFGSASVVVSIAQR